MVKRTYVMNCPTFFYPPTPSGRHARSDLEPLIDVLLIPLRDAFADKTHPDYSDSEFLDWLQMQLELRH